MGEKQEDGEQLSSVEKMAAAPPKQGRNMYTMACTMLASLASILLGYDIGVMSGAQKFIQKELDISDTQVEILLGILDVYSLVGSFAAGFTSDWIGRRYTIVLAAAIFFAGALLMGFAMNYAFLMFGRFFAGVGVGYALMIAPTYTAEVAPASSRGFLTSFPEVFINVGILLGYISNYAFSHLRQSLGWRFMLGVAAIPAVFLGFGVLAMPESPRWLVMRGRLGDAKEVLEKTCDSPEEARLRLADIKLAAGIPEECYDDVVAVPKKNRDKRGSLEGAAAAAEAVGAPCADRRPGDPLLPADVGDRLGGAVHSPGFPGGRDQVGRRAAGDDGGGGFHQNSLHPGGNLLPRPSGEEAAAAGELRRDDRVAVGAGDRDDGGGQTRRRRASAPVGGGAQHQLHTGLRGVFLHRRGAHRVGVQLGDLPAATAGAGGRHGGGREPGHQRRHRHDLHLALQGHHAGGQLLLVRWNGGGGMGVLLHILAGDAGQDAGGDAGALWGGKEDGGGAAGEGEGRHHRSRNGERR